jgi:EAL domain-containing protein (putative c-di-GMP-specific phosphodiesterase class I)
VFVAGDESPRYSKLLRALVLLAHHLGKPVVVEGVEFESQRERLADSGCDMLQGFLLGRPVSPAELASRHLNGVVV